MPAVDLGPAARFWIALVDRYRPGGGLGRARGWIDGYGITAYEVENEPGQLPWWGTWGRVPKDYAAFLAAFVPDVRRLCPSCVIAAPSLAQGDSAEGPTGLDGIPWLDEMLSDQPSEWQSSTYDADAVKPAGGPFIDAYSWHYDAYDPTTFAVVTRAAQVRAAVVSPQHARPASRRANAQLWYSEGGVLGQSGDQVLFSRASSS